MSNSNTTYLIVSLILMGSAPFVLMAAWIVQRRRLVLAEQAARSIEAGDAPADFEAAEPRRFGLTEAALATLVLVAVVAAVYLYVDRQGPHPTTDHSQHEQSDGPPILQSGSRSGDGMAGMPGMEDDPGSGASAAAPAVDHSGALPETLAGLPRIKLATGAEALASTDRMHGKEFPLADAAIGSYAGPGGRAELWGSWPTDPAAAGPMATDMAAKISEGNSAFDPPTEIEPGLWRTLGHDQVHYFFAAGPGVWWLSVDPALESAALAEASAAAGRAARG